MKNFNLIFYVVFLCVFFVNAQVATTLNDFFMPGSQPLESGDLSTPDACSCHEYDISIEAYFNWQGSMMAQSMRDQLFVATMSIAMQDADSSADLCLRCHTPTGWLSGRSEPPDGSALIDEDYTGVNCLFCHRMIVPEELGTDPYPTDQYHKSIAASSTGITTYFADSVYTAQFISAHIPPTYANGMFVVTTDDERRGPYTDPANPNHGYYYSAFHNTSDNCGTCHDVSNPVYSRNPDGTYSLNNLDEQAPDFSPYEMFPVERTYSEWKMSAYNSENGISGTVFGGNKTSVSTCQDCHMKDVTGQGSSRGNSPVRDDLGLHDLTGGNTFMPQVLKTQFAGIVNAAALDSAISRATWMLQNAATMELSVIGTELSVRIQNETGHKLPSGYPEGRRMWINIQAYDESEILVYESGAYNVDTGVLTHDEDVKIYEIEPGLSPGIADVLGKDPGPSFHFVLNDTIYKDNRIPPRGFTNANFAQIQSPPVGYSYEDGQYWDVTSYELPESRYTIVATLYYQTTSKEYIEFLRDENTTDSNGQLMYDLWDQHGKSAPVIMVQESWQDTPSAINSSNPAGIISKSDLIINSANPFNNQIRFKYNVSESSPVEISIFSLNGSKIKQLVNRLHGSGSYEISWIANNEASGTYFVLFKTDQILKVKKVILIK